MIGCSRKIADGLSAVCTTKTTKTPKGMGQISSYPLCDLSGLCGAILRPPVDQGFQAAESLGGKEG